MNWLSIDTAPHVSSPPVDLWHSEDGRYTDCSYHGGVWYQGNTIINNQDKITHWMPIPDPPNEK